MIGQVRVKFLLLALAGLVCVAVGGAEARAGYNAALVGGTPSFDAVNNNFVYTYALTQASSDQVSPGNFVRFYDFNGYVTNSAAGPNANWSATTTGFNGNPPSVILTHGDDAAIPNVTFTYNGATPDARTNLGNFVLRSVFGLGSSFKDFYGFNTNSGANNTGIDTRLSYVAPVPEPTSFISAGLGILGLGLGLGFRARSKRAA